MRASSGSIQPAGNTVTGLMTAMMDSVPMLVICGQTVTWMLGK